MLQEICYQNTCVAIPRYYAPFFQEGIPCCCQEGAHFCYLNLTNETNTGDYLRSLSLVQKAELWQEFLQDGAPALEFEWLWEAYRKKETGLLEWELTLEAVIEKLGIEVKNEERKFQVTDAGGHPIRFDYTRGRAAEKIFLKILFPVVLERE